MEFYNGKKLRHFGLLPDMVASRYGDKTAFFFEGEEQSFTEFSIRSTRLASSLADRGIEAGDRVGIYMPNTIQFPETIFGIIKSGAIPVPLNLRMPSRTLVYVLKNSNVDTIFASGLETNNSSPEEAKELTEECEVNRFIIPGGSSLISQIKEGINIIDYNRLVKAGDPDFDYPVRSEQDITIQYYTSGTTGKPKGVPLTHKNILTCIEGHVQTVGVEPDYRTPLVMPLYHANGLTLLLGIFIYRGASLVIQSEPDPELILRNIDNFNCNLFNGVPALFRMMWLVYQENPEKYDLSSLESVVCSSAPLDEETRRKIKREWKVRFIEGWGMTETSPAGTAYLDKVPKGAGCVGWPHPHIELKIVDPTTRETIVPWEAIAPWGKFKEKYVEKKGELALRGPTVFDGYYKMPEENEEVFDEDGWYYTGDIGKLDEDKALWISGRTDDMINPGGEKVHPSAVEEALMEHPQINEAAVVAAPHKTKGEVPVAFVVADPAIDLDEKEIKEFSLQRVPTYAHPRKVFFKNNLPKSGALKTQRFKLEKEAEESLSKPLG